MPILFAVIPLLLVIGLAVLVIVYRRMREAETAEAKLRGILASALDGIAIFDSEGRIALANTQVERLFGYGQGELAGRRAQSLLAGLPPPTADAPTPLNLVGRHKDGGTVPVEVRFCPQPTAGGTLVAGVIRDTTERRRAEAALNLRDRAIESLAWGVFFLDARRPGNPVVFANPSFERMAGRGQGDIVGRPWADVLGAAIDPETRAAFEAAFRDRASLTREYCGTRADGSSFWNSLTVTPLSDPDGAAHFVGVLADVTERKRLEAQYRQAQKMEAVGRLAGGVAHDFNNLLTVILGHSEMVLSALSPEHPGRASVQEIHRAGERATLLTRQLLAFSRKQVLTPTVLSLNDLVADLEKMLRRLIREDIELILELAPELHPVKVDAGQMGQVVMNLLVNARDAMPHGGAVAVRTANVELTPEPERPEVRPGPYVLLEVRDTGCGIDEAVKAHIFEPFYTTKGQGQGTGLGLATVYGIVKQSGGYVYVQNEPGRGAVFSIYLPRACGETAAVSTADGSPAPARARGETVLLVEDEDAVREMALQALRGNGYTVLAAKDGPEALRLSHGHPGRVHLLLTDVVMPWLNGRELARQLTQERPDLRVLFMTGYCDDPALRDGVTSTELALLPKPFRADTLLHKVREVLDRPAARGALDSTWEWKVPPRDKTPRLAAGR